MYTNDLTRVLTGECRLSYCHLTEPYANQPGQEPKYSVTLLIPKTDAATKAALETAVKAATTAGVSGKWGGVCPPVVASPVHDGDGVRQSGEPFGAECKGCWVLTASSKQPPQVVSPSNLAQLLPATDIYSGMYARVSLRFFAYNNSGKKGVGCGLGNVLKTRDGEPLAGGASAASDFAGLGTVGGAAADFGFGANNDSLPF